MVPTVRLEKSGIITSRLGFGTSRLHYLKKRDRERLLAAAADLGIIHFDTAPAYGDGLSEAELGNFIRGRRERFVVATKYGIPPHPLVTAWPQLFLPVRTCRVIARTLGFRPGPLPPMTPADLRASAERSLRRMRTDRIDILFLHEPRPERISSIEAILDEFYKLQQRGIVLAFGVAGGWSGINELLSATPGLGLVVQTAESEWLTDAVPDITYGVVATRGQTYLSSRIAPSDAAQRLLLAAGRRRSGAFLVSTTKLAHLTQLANVIAGKL